MKNFKTLLFSISFILLIGTNGAAQGMPVYDNTNFISLAKQLFESAKQTSQLLKTVEFLHEQKERIEKVSSAIKQLQAVREITRNNQRLLGSVQRDLKEILNSPYIRPEEVEQVAASFTDILEQSMRGLEFINRLLSSDHFKMSDGERTLMLQQYETASREMVSQVQRKTHRYREVIAFRKLQDKVNNRQRNY